MRSLLFAFFLAAIAAPAQNSDLHDNSKSTRIPQNAVSFGPSDINSQLLVLTERIADMQKALERVEENQVKATDREHGLDLKITAMQSKDQGRSEQSDSSFKLISGAFIPLISSVVGAIIGSVVVVFLSRKYLNPTQSPNTPVKARAKASGR